MFRRSIGKVRVPVAFAAALCWGSAAGSVVAFADDGKVRNFDHPHVAGELIVKFHGGLQASDVSLLRAFGATVKRSFRASGAQRLELADGATAESTRVVAERLAADPAVEYVEANTIVHVVGTPDDPQLGSLWGMSKIAAPAAWDVTTGSRDVVVGVIDTGVNYDHPDIKDNYWFNPGETGTDDQGRDKSTNRVDDDDNGYVDDFRGWDFANNDNNPMDDHNHGTHCAGTIGGRGNNGVGVVGVNWVVSVVGLKFMSASGGGSIADAVEAVEYATALGMDVTNNSWGGGGRSSAMEAALEEATAKGVMFVAAAGNSRSNNDRTSNYPSNYPFDNVIAVAATDQSDRLASFSSYGATTVDLAAPGVDVLSTTGSSAYSKMSGTSMAAPHVTGAVALIMAAHPDFTWEEVKAKLLSSVDPVSSLSGKVLTGGRLNVDKAVQ